MEKKAEADVIPEEKKAEADVTPEEKKAGTIVEIHSKMLAAVLKTITDTVQWLGNYFHEGAYFHKDENLPKEFISQLRYCLRHKLIDQAQIRRSIFLRSSLRITIGDDNGRVHFYNAIAKVSRKSKLLPRVNPLVLVDSDVYRQTDTYE